MVLQKQMAIDAEKNIIDNQKRFSNILERYQDNENPYSELR